MERTLVSRLDQLEKNFQQSLADKINGEVNQLRTMLGDYRSFQELIALSELIQADVAQDKFPEQHLGESLVLIEKLSTSDGITEQSRFLEVVKIVIDLLVRTDRMSEIDKLEKALSNVLVTNRKISLDLADHYGQVIISSPYPVEDLQPEFEALSRYAHASREMNYPEKALMWELFVAYKRNDYT